MDYILTIVAFRGLKTYSVTYRNTVMQTVTGLLLEQVVKYFCVWLISTAQYHDDQTQTRLAVSYEQILDKSMSAKHVP